MNLPSDLKERVLAAAARQDAPTRPQLEARAAMAYAIAASAMAILFLAAGGVEHSQSRPFSYTIGIAAGASAIALAATVAVFRRGRAMLGPSSRAQLLVVLLVPALTFGWMLLWHDHYVDPFVRVGFRCLALTLLLASGPLFVATALRSGTVLRAPKVGGAAIAAASGAWAAVGVDLWCPLTETKHVAFGHVLPIVLLIALGAVFGETLLRARGRRSDDGV